jgi:ribonuclease D
MYYLTDESNIKEIISELSEADILWLDTEVADYNTKKPRLSLIQVLAYPQNLDGSRTCIIDVLDKTDLVEFFIDKIMKNKEIIKVFHNAKYDLKFLGKTKAKNVICTLELSRKIPYYLLPVKNHTLKTLTEYLTQFKNLSKEEQGSDWGIRPLTQTQLEYAKMDTVYLAQIYHKLTELESKIEPEPLQEDLENLGKRYLEIEEQWKLLDSEIQHIEARLKKAMLLQNKDEISAFKLSYSQRTTIKTDFSELVKLVNSKSIELDFSVTLTKEIQTKIGNNLDELKTETETKTISSLNKKNEQ